MKMTSTLAVFLTTLLLAGTASAAQFYKWTDDQGVTHYSEEPPPASAGKASEVKVRTKLPSGSKEILNKAANPKAADKATDDKAAAKKDDKAAAKPTAAENKTPEQYAEKCQNLKNNMQILQEHGRIKETAPDGSVRPLTEEEKNQRIDETQRQIKAFCEG